MKTTLKRGVGRTSETSGNGRAVPPPDILTPVTHYRQPPRRRSFLGILGRIFLLLIAALTSLGFGVVGVLIWPIYRPFAQQFTPENWQPFRLSLRRELW